jgi:hypothetical protein
VADLHLTSTRRRTRLRAANPVGGVLADARYLYRRNVVRLTRIAAVLFLPAAGLDLLIANSDRSGAWAVAVDGLAAFLLAGVVAGILSRSLPGAAGPARPDTRMVLSALLTAAILAAAAAASKYGGPVLGHFDSLADIPAFCVTIIGILAVPAVVVERLNPGRALLRSWQLIRGHSWHFLAELGMLYFGFVLVMIVPEGIVSWPSIASPRATALLGPAGGILYGPFAALVVALIYFRLAEARQPSTPDEAAGQSG